MNSRVRARIAIGIVLLAANGYALLVLYTFFLGHSTLAHIDHCVSGSKHTACYGHWRDADGLPDSGEIADVSSERDGDVPIVDGPLGAYRDDPVGPSVRMFFPLAADVGLILGFRLVGRYKRTMRTDVSALLAPGAALILIAEDGTARTRDEAVFLRPGSTPGQVCDSIGTPVFAIDRTDPGHGEPGVGVLRPDGSPIGVVRRGHVGYGVVFGMFVADRELLRATATQGALTLDLPTGQRVGGIGWVRGGQWVLRLEVPLAEPEQTLVFALLLEIHRLTGIRTLSRTTSALGRGWAE